MRLRIKKFFIIILCVTGALMLSVAGISVIFGDRIVSYVIAELNKNLTTKVKVEKINFSLLRKFPCASIELQNVYAAPAKPFSQNDTLIFAKKIFLIFDFFDAIAGNYDLKKVVVENASLKMITDLKGNESFDVWKTDSTQSQKSTFKLNFNEVSCKNVMLQYHNLYQKEFYEVMFEDSRLSGRLSNANYVLRTAGDIYIYKIQLGNEEYVSNKKAKIDFDLDVDDVNKTYRFKPSLVKLEGLNLAIQGKLRNQPGRTDIDLTLNSDKADIISLLSVIPKSNLGVLSEYGASGDVSFNARISGVIAGKISPSVTINFSAVSSELTPPHSAYTLKNISFKGFYTNKKSPANPVNYLSLKNVNAVLEGNSIHGNFEMENSEKPFVKMALEGNFDLRQLSDFYKPDTIEKIEGLLSVNAQFTGQIGNATGYASSGTAQLQQVNFTLKNSPTTFQNFSSKFNLKDNELLVDRLSGTVAGSGLRINGAIANIFDYLFLDNRQLNIDADFVSDKINLDDIIVEGDRRNDTTGGIHFSPYLNCNLIVSIGELHYKKFSATKVNGSVTIEDGALNTNSLNMHTMDGAVNLQGTIDASRGDSLLISYTAKLDQLNITKVFENMGNFDETFITDKNVKGHVSATVQFASTWSRQLKLNQNSLYSKCDITIENGELINFEPMLALGKFVKGTDLHNVKFETLHNAIEIKSKKIFIPVMDIRSSAINLTASGTHGFDNMVDYKIRMELSQLLNKKVKDLNTEFGVIEDDGLGRWKLFLTMKGEMSNPKFSYDKKGVQQNIAKEFKEEKQTMKSVLNKEFGWFKKDSVVAKQNQQQQKKKEEIQVDYNNDDKE